MVAQISFGAMRCYRAFHRRRVTRGFLIARVKDTHSLALSLSLFARAARPRFHRKKEKRRRKAATEIIGTKPFSSVIIFFVSVYPWQRWYRTASIKMGNNWQEGRIDLLTQDDAIAIIE